MSGSASLGCAQFEREPAPGQLRDDVAGALDAIWPLESAKVIGAAGRIVRDIALAEDMAHDALVAALEEWPRSGIPPNPGAWLVLTAKRRALDLLRHRSCVLRKHQEQGPPALAETPNYEAALDHDVQDDQLRLILTACHPVVPAEARVAMTLRLVGGLTVAEIARAYLVGEATIAQRIVRAKRTLARAGVAFELPSGADRVARVSSALDVIYLVFNEGYTATAGNDLIRPILCDEALRLGRILAEVIPGDCEVHALAALMELQASRLPARVTPSGEAVLLRDQNRDLWDRLLVRRGLAALDRAERAAGTRGEYFHHASIAACHARATRMEETDWPRIVAAYDALARVAPSPVVELNRAVAMSMAKGAAAAMPIVEGLAREPALRQYPYLHSVRAELFLQSGDRAAARLAFERAAALTKNARERELMLARAHSAETYDPLGSQGARAASSLLIARVSRRERFPYERR